MIFWVYGGTAVGKKHFIDRAVRSPAGFGLPPCRPVWIQDGDMSAEQLLDEAKVSPILVRWQWGRENNIGLIREIWPSLPQLILLIRSNVSVQAQRVILREGSARWNEWMLRRESEDVQHLVEELSMQHGVAVRYIDGNG
jgi:hypothetical protein